MGQRLSRARTQSLARFRAGLGLLLALTAVALLACGPAAPADPVPGELAIAQPPAQEGDATPEPTAEPEPQEDQATPEPADSWESEPTQESESGGASSDPTPEPAPEPTERPTEEPAPEPTGEPEPEPTPYPTKVGAGQKKYQNVRGRLRDWALAAEEAERESESGDGARGSSEHIGAIQRELTRNGGVIGARVRVDTRVENAESTIVAWLTENGISHEALGGIIAVQLLPSQLSKLGPLSELDAVYSIEEPGRAFPDVQVDTGQFVAEPDRGPPAPAPPVETNSAP